MIIILTTIVFASGLGYFGYRAYILAGRLVDSEEYIEELTSVNQFMYDRILMVYDKMTEIDRLGAFEKDDEAGTTFEMLKEVITNLKDQFDGEAQEEK